MEVLKWAVEQECISKRIDVFLAEELEEMDYTISRRIQKLAEQQYLKVNDKNVKSNYKLKPKDIIALTIPDVEPVEILPENIDIDILYEDKDVIVVNKPQGMVVHPAPGHYSGTIVNALLFHCIIAGDSFLVSMESNVLVLCIELIKTLQVYLW